VEGPAYLGAMIAWDEVFRDAHPNPPLEADQLAGELARLAAPLTPSELEELAGCVGGPPQSLRTSNPVAEHGLPEDLVDFYRWCDGGDFSVGERRFEPVLRLREIREYLVTYGVIHWMPGCIPLAMDGGACFYLLDLRARPAPCVLFGGMGELADPRFVRPLSETFRGLFADGRDPVAVTGL
jgi:SMI1 / KNR4 family (SUKH-1)